MEAAAAIATTVEAAAATTAVEPSSSSSSSVTAMLGKSGQGCTNENEGSDTCEKRLQQGGFRHISSSTNERRFSAREGKPPLSILPLIGHSFQAGSCPVGLEIRSAALYENGLRKLVGTGHFHALTPTECLGLWNNRDGSGLRFHALADQVLDLRP